MTLSEFIYTVILKPPPLKRAANRLILSLLPKTVNIGSAIVHLNPQDPVVSGALSLGVFERDELAFFARFCREGMTVIDVGANVGTYTACAMHRIKNNGVVVAIEPHAESRQYLVRTIDANAKKLSPENLPRVHVSDAAAASFEGAARLFVNPNNKGDNRLYCSELTPENDSVEIRSRTIDAILQDLGIHSADFMKLDIQGYEFEAVQGARKTIENSKRMIILSEFWPDGIRQASSQHASAYLELLSNLGFAIYELKSDKMILLRGTDDFNSLISRLSGRKYTNIACLKAISPEQIN